MGKDDPEEKQFLQAYGRGAWKSTRPSKKTLSKYQGYARATFAKDRRVNIRLSSKDVEDLQVRALEEGVPYQTLMASVLHKFVNGRLVEKPSGLSARSRRTARKRAAA